jgi:SAM-dependent methyltransferase
LIAPEQRFSAAADLYHRHRPSYPGVLVDWILEETGTRPPALVADVGCGTGISTRLLAERGLEVIGIDPNEEMLVRARERGGARYLRGRAVATGLETASVRLVTVAQAFHWFDTEAAIREFRRILGPAGWCVAFWNVRDAAPGLMSEYDSLLRTWSREYGLLESHESTLARLARSPEVADPRRAEFAFAERLDRRAFFGRVSSSSYVLHGVDDRVGFEAALEDLFCRHESEGRLELRYRAVALCFRPRTGPTRSRAPSVRGPGRV